MRIYYYVFILIYCCILFFSFFVTSDVYTLSLHDALPISISGFEDSFRFLAHGDIFYIPVPVLIMIVVYALAHFVLRRSEEHTSELQSRGHLVCRLLLEKKKKHTNK